LARHRTVSHMPTLTMAGIDFKSHPACFRIRGETGRKLRGKDILSAV
jgi:hypothetical protein